jgi:hypothetical protein
VTDLPVLLGLSYRTPIVGIEGVPLSIFWTAHALKRLPERGLTRDMVERAVLENHVARESNVGEADWRVDAGRFLVVYDFPVGDNWNAIRIITAWPKRRNRRRNLKLISGEKESYPDL